VERISSSSDHLFLGKFDAKYSIGESGASVCVNPLGVQSIFFFFPTLISHMSSMIMWRCFIGQILIYLERMKVKCDNVSHCNMTISDLMIKKIETN